LNLATNDQLKVWKEKVEKEVEGSNRFLL